MARPPSRSVPWARWCSKSIHPARRRLLPPLRSGARRRQGLAGRRRAFFLWGPPEEFVKSRNGLSWPRFPPTLEASPRPGRLEPRLPPGADHPSAALHAAGWGLVGAGLFLFGAFRRKSATSKFFKVETVCPGRVTKVKKSENLPLSWPRFWRLSRGRHGPGAKGRPGLAVPLDGSPAGPGWGADASGRGRAAAGRGRLKRGVAFVLAAKSVRETRPRRVPK